MDVPDKLLLILVENFNVVVQLLEFLRNLFVGIIIIV